MTRRSYAASEKAVGGKIDFTIQLKENQVNPRVAACFFSSLDHFIRSREKLRRKCQSDLFRCLQVDHKLKLRCLLHRRISRFGTFQDLVHINSRAPVEVLVVRPIGHETAGFHILLL
jgi:hypothetical protein